MNFGGINKKASENKLVSLQENALDSIAGKQLRRLKPGTQWLFQAVFDASGQGRMELGLGFRRVSVRTGNGSMSIQSLQLQGRKGFGYDDSSRRKSIQGSKSHHDIVVKGRRRCCSFLDLHGSSLFGQKFFSCLLT